MSGLSGKLAIVTGGSSGIGFAIAQKLAASGMDILLLARDSEKLALACQSLAASAPEVNVNSQAIDFGESEANLRALLGAVHDDKLGVLVHSAGTFSAENILDVSQSDLELMFRVNVSSALILAKRFMKALEVNHGQIVIVNSSVAQQTAKAVPGGYSATKHAAKALADALRDTLNSRGVRVLSVYPGRTATPMQKAIFESEGRDYPAAQLLQADDVATVVNNALELPRTAEVTDISVRPMQKT